MILANQLKSGDVIVSGPDYQHRVKVLSGPHDHRDLFGRPMLRFEMEIVGGPDRIGDTGPMIFGPDAEVRLVC